MVQLDAVRDSIVRSTSPRKIILFGSRARGDSTEQSDFDLVVVVERGADAERLRVAALLAARELGASLDLIVLDPDSLEAEESWESSVVHQAMEYGKVIYEAAG